jgi:hypothetical protein
MKFPLKQVQNNQNSKKLFLTNLIKKKNRSEDLHNFEAWMFKLQELISIMKKKKSRDIIPFHLGRYMQMLQCKLLLDT